MSRVTTPSFSQIGDGPQTPPLDLLDSMKKSLLSRAWVVEPEQEADVCREERDLLVHVDEAAAVHDAEAGEDQVGHQHEHDQDQGTKCQQ